MFWNYSYLFCIFPIIAVPCNKLRTVYTIKTTVLADISFFVQQSIILPINSIHLFLYLLGQSVVFSKSTNANIDIDSSILLFLRRDRLCVYAREYIVSQFINISFCKNQSSIIRSIQTSFISFGYMIHVDVFRKRIICVKYYAFVLYCAVRVNTEKATRDSRVYLFFV